MFKYLCLAAGLVFAGATTAQACSYLPSEDYVTGRIYSRYYPPEIHTPSPILREGVSLAVIRTELIKQVDSNHGNHKENVLRHIVLDTLTSGSISIQDENYTHDPNVVETQMEPSFQMWNKNIKSSPVTYVGAISDSCGNAYPRRTLQPDSLYLAFVKKGQVGSALPLETPSDSIVEAYRKIATKAPDAPNVMSAKTYFQHMKDFIEIEVLECPKSEDFGYKDSRFGSADKQVDVLYQLGNRTREPRRAFDIRNVFSYVQQMKGESSFVEPDKVDCQFGDRYLYIPTNGGLYLKIENGLIDTSKIATSITLIGPQKINSVDVERWIKEANPED